MAMIKNDSYDKNNARMDGKYSFARTLTGDLFLQTYANIRGARERGEVSASERSERAYFSL